MAPSIETFSKSSPLPHVFTQSGPIPVIATTTERTRPLVAVLDNGPIHCGKLTTRALAERTRLTLEWLPKYAPELNDIERCWRDLKQHCLANRIFADPDALARTIPDAVVRLN